jgi:hypothetical protein
MLSAVGRARQLRERLKNPPKTPFKKLRFAFSTFALQSQSRGENRTAKNGWAIHQ